MAVRNPTMGQTVAETQSTTARQAKTVYQPVSWRYFAWNCPILIIFFHRKRTWSIRWSKSLTGCG